MRNATLLVTLATSSLLYGCVLDDQMSEYEDIGVEYRDLGVSNDAYFNTAQMNGTQYNGTQYNGTQYNGTQYNGVALQGTELAGVVAGTNDPISGTDFIGATMIALLEDTSELEIKLQDIYESGTPGLKFYTVEYDNGGTWTNVCPSGVDAIPVPGIWDKTTGDWHNDGTLFTFACRGAALAKCMEWGYEHGAIKQECDGGTCVDQPLDDFHLACVRMVRADYCGDGSSHTENGTLIDMWDATSVAVEDTGITLPFEAEWTAGGAACIKHTRWEDSTTSSPEYDYIQANCPSRWVGPSDTTCGGATTDFNTSVGLSTSTSVRRLFRNKSDNNLRSP